MTGMESSAQPHVAGSSVMAVRVFLDERLGQQGFQRVLKELPPHLSEPVAGILLPVNWYPTESYMALLHAALPLIGPSFYDELGEFAADYEITTFQRFLLRFTSPGAFVEHTGRLWPRFHNTGSWTVESTGKQAIRGTLRDFGVVDAAFCRVMMAWVRRAGRISAPRFEVRHPECRARGAPACVFTGAW
jgi:hypothetical protein